MILTVECFTSSPVVPARPPCVGDYRILYIIRVAHRRESYHKLVNTAALLSLEYCR